MILALGVACTAAQAAPPAPALPQVRAGSSPLGGLDEQGLQAIHDALAAAIARRSTPGAVYWCGHGAHERHWAQGERARVPAVEPMTEDTLFDAASLTKVVATLPSVLLLLERGQLRLEDPVRAHLPEFPWPGITVRNLLTHTSGLVPDLPASDKAWQGYEAGLRHVCASVPLLPPGREFRYSDLNFILLGEIVHRVSGRTLDRFAAEEVFAPLGMTSSTFNPGPALLAHTAPTMRDEQGVMLRGVVHDPTARRMGGVAGHAGLFTTAADLARYARFMLRGGPLLKPATLRLMRSVQTPATVFERRGLGWDLDSSFSRPRGDLYALGSFGHTGYTGTAMWLDPATDSFYVLLTTRLHPDGTGDNRALYHEIGTLTARAVGLTERGSGSLFPRAPGEVPTVLNGIDVLEREGFAALKGLRIGLVTNHTGLDNERRATLDLLAAAPGVRLVRLFSPEHGLRGVLDQPGIPDAVDVRTGLPVVSLYEKDRRAPEPAHLADLDALVVDLQDVGCRFYTYMSTLRGCLQAAAAAGKRVIVLDRVNPVRGDRVEGPAAPDELGFTACHPIAVRHGMTLGELAGMFRSEQKLDLDLTVIKVQGWRRDQWYDATGLPWQKPSPNLASLTAAALYPGVGLLEYAISVGRGTGTPFEVLGAPYIDDRVLAHELNKLGLSGVSFLPERFTPTASVFKDQACGGVRILLTDRDAARPVALGLAVAHTLHRLYGKDFDLKKFNTLLASEATIGKLQAGQDWRAILKGWEAETEAFRKRRQTFLLYPAIPGDLP